MNRRDTLSGVSQNYLKFCFQTNGLPQTGQCTALKSDIKFSVVDILGISCARVLIENPMVNAYLMDDGLHMHNYTNIGIACQNPKRPP